MSQWKDVLCLLAIFLAYGLAGHLDYQDAIAMEEAMRADAPAPCATPLDAAAQDGAPPSPELVPARVAVAAVPLACRSVEP